MPGGYKKLGEWLQENPEAALEAKRLAGRKSGESRRKKKAMKDYLANLLTLKTETGDLYTDITIALIDKALSGDVRRYEVIRSTLGQDAPQLIEMASNTIKINITGEDESGA